MKKLESIFFLFISFFIISPAYAAENLQRISFGQLYDIAVSNSPEIRTIEENHDINISEGKVDLEWSNPEISYSQEFVKNGSEDEREHYITLSKEFEMPWIYFLRKDFWALEYDAEEYEKKQKIIDFLSEIKSGYVELKLTGNQIYRLEELNSIISRTSEIAKSQYEEGDISGIEQNLIAMSVNNLDSRLAGLQDKKRKLEKNWKSSMGIDHSERIKLVTDISYEPFESRSLDSQIAGFSGNAGLLGKEKNLLSAEKKLKLEEKSIVPGFEIYGGYKNVSPDYNGYLMGLSFKLPFLNQNQAQIQKTEAQLSKAENNYLSYKLETRNDIRERIESIKFYDSLLNKLSPQFKSTRDLMSKTVFSYREGQIELTQLLSALQIYAENTEQYYSHLTDYYKNIFALESLINKNIISFTEKGQINGESNEQ